MLFQQPAGVPLDAPVDPGALLAAMLGALFFSLLTAVTRARPLALVWRVCSLVCAAVPVVQVMSWWSINDPTGTLSTGNPGALEGLLGMVPTLPQLPDLSGARPPEGLEIMALVWAVALIGFFLLTVRGSRQTR
jgi:hypothetical protein